MLKFLFKRREAPGQAFKKYKAGSVWKMTKLELLKVEATQYLGCSKKVVVNMLTTRMEEITDEAVIARMPAVLSF